MSEKVHIGWIGFVATIEAIFAISRSLSLGLPEVTQAESSLIVKEAPLIFVSSVPGNIFGLHHHIIGLGSQVVFGLTLFA